MSTPMEYLPEMQDEPMEPTEVGGAMVSEDGEDIVVELEPGSDKRMLTDEHDENLADLMEPSERRELGEKLIGMVDTDKESRKEWEKRLIKGLETIGVDEIDWGDEGPFDGASTVTHPAIAEAMVRFQANAMEELFPAEGPVKAKVVGETNPELEQQRTRVQNFMNYQLTEADDEYFEHTDQMTMYLPYAGSAFKKVFYNDQDEVVEARFVDAEHFIVPYDATSLYNSPRYTHWYKLTGNQIREKMASGEFIETDQINFSSTSSMAATDGRELQDTSDHREVSRDEEDEVYDLYEVHCELLLEDFDEPEGSEGFEVALPYAVTVEKESGEILAIRRLWREGDEKRRKRVHFVHYKFLPGLGFYGWGYLHIIGSLGKAASGALRALLDGSATASLQGGFKSREAKGAGEVVFTPGVWKDIDMTAEDLAKSFYTPPFKEPSPALFHTLELLVTGIKEFSSTTEAMTGAGDNKGPVGTTLALIEQGSKVYSGIHKRMHKAAAMEFKIIAELNYEHMPDEYPYDATGDNVILSEDFDGRVDVIPVSDPNIYSNTQRVAQAQAALELVSSDPTLYDDEARRQAHLDMHRALRTPAPERFLPDKRTKRIDPVTENQMVLTGGAVKAYAEQDHQSHLKTHQMFMMEVEGMGLEEGMLQAFKTNMMAHMAEHYAHAYRLRVEQELGAPLPDTDFKDSRDTEDMPIEIDNAVARAVAANIAPPPPPQQALDEQKMAEDKHQQELRHRDEKHQLKLRQEQEEAALERKLESEEHEQEMRNKAAASVFEDADRARKLTE